MGVGGGARGWEAPGISVITGRLNPSLFNPYEHEAPPARARPPRDRDSEASPQDAGAGGAEVEGPRLHERLFADARRRCLPFPSPLSSFPQDGSGGGGGGVGWRVEAPSCGMPCRLHEGHFANPRRRG